MARKIYEISDFSMDPSTRQLFHRGAPVSISSRAFDLLECLVEEPGVLIRKSALLERVWFDSYVEESNLAVHVSALRRVLKEKRGECKFIQTVSGRGYRFVAPVRVVENESTSTAGLPKPEAAPVSIAILPLGLSAASPDLEYLADGITRSLIDDLSSIEGLKVLAYSAVRQYQNSPLDLQETGFLLGANLLLAGRIVEHRGRLEIGMELIRASDRSHLWGLQQEFALDDVFRVKREISLAIAEKLKLKLTPSAQHDLDRAGELDPAAQKLYFRARFVLESRGVEQDVRATLAKALGLFEQAIERDPNHALAYTGIGAVYGSMFNHSFMTKPEALARSRQAIETALRIDDRLSQAYVLRGSTLIFFERDFAAADIALDRAIELNRNNADAYHWKSYSLMFRGRLEEAFAFGLKATEFDPVSTRYNGNLARIFFFSGQYEKAIVQAEELLQFEKKDLTSYLFAALSYAHLGQADTAREFMQMGLECRDSPDTQLCQAYIFALTGRTVEAWQILASIFENFPLDQIDHVGVALVHAALGDIETGFAALAVAEERDDPDLNIIRADLRFRSFYGDSRFHELLDRLGFDPLPPL
jgi:DNA-binding winged helix-turn-helix (wHTH) protein/Tfp pilus assembly protein PilF